MAHVLLLEPNRLLARSYVAGIEQGGHSVAWQTNAQHAMASIDERMPDVIVAELQLAVHNGVEFLYELRSYADLAQLPVVVLSFLPKQEFEQHATSANLSIAEYLYKPKTSIAELANVIARHVPVTA